MASLYIALPCTRSRRACSKRCASEDEREQADNDEQTDQEDDSYCTREELEHAVHLSCNCTILTGGAPARFLMRAAFALTCI
jgi:hypothetical protein